jgi:hypothetical protein
MDISFIYRLNLLLIFDLGVGVVVSTFLDIVVAKSSDLSLAGKLSTGGVHLNINHNAHYYSQFVKLNLRLPLIPYKLLALPWL